MGQVFWKISVEFSHLFSATVQNSMNKNPVELKFELLIKAN
jgi:hypothetical protein